VPATGTCNLALTIDTSALNIQLSNGLRSITGLSGYFFGTSLKPPLLNIEGGNLEQADVVTPFHFNPLAGSAGGVARRHSSLPLVKGSDLTAQNVQSGSR